MKTCLFKYIENFITKNWNFSDNNSDIFHISAQNIDCRYSLELPRRGSSNKYLQSMFLSRNKKNIVYPCKPQFYYIKVGSKGVNLIWVMFSWWKMVRIIHQVCPVPLTLVMLNKLSCPAHFWFPVNQITWSGFLIEIHIFNDKQCRSRSVGFFRSQLIWIYTVCWDRVCRD